MPATLTSQRYKVESLDAAVEFCYAKGWSDGLPVVPPTEPAVRAMLEAAGLAPDAEVAYLSQRAVRITAEKVAINAVMAGCLPEYAPVVVAAVDALCAPEHNVNGSAASTGGSAPLIIVTGPIAKRIGMNGGVNLFGPGNRANATIGRAIRLILMNVGGATPGVMDKSTIGHPGKYSYCITEDDDARPWPPFHTQRGLPAEASAVTVYASAAPLYVDNHHSNTTEGILRTIASSMASVGRLGLGAFAVVLCPEHVAVIAREGWGADRIRESLAREARASVAHLKRTGRLPGDPTPADEEEHRYAVRGPDDILLLVGGGSAGGFSAVIPPWAGGRSSRPVTREIR
jgi:hypothetical protein